MTVILHLITGLGSGGAERMLTRIAKHDFGGEIRQMFVSLIDDAVHADTILILFFAAWLRGV